MGLMLKLNLSPCVMTIIKALLWAVIMGLLWALLWAVIMLHLESQNRAYKFFYILKMY